MINASTMVSTRRVSALRNAAIGEGSTLRPTQSGSPRSVTNKGTQIT